MGDAVAVAEFEANLRVPVWKRNETAQGRPIYSLSVIIMVFETSLFSLGSGFFLCSKNHLKSGKAST
jgi:hypothetical protein